MRKLRRRMRKRIRRAKRIRAIRLKRGGFHI